MSKIVYKLVYNRKKHLNKDGKALVQVEAYLNGKKKYFSTQIYLKPEQWNPKRRMAKRHPNADGLNQMMLHMVAALEKKELELWLHGKPVTLEALKTAQGDRAMTNQGFFLPFCQKEIAASCLKESSKRNHRSTLRLLHGFKKDVSFAELDYGFVADFEAYLQAEGYHTNTIAKHMKHLKRCINTAINKGLIEMGQYAFRKYRIKTIPGKHTHLTPDELAKLERLRLQPEEKKHQQTLDAFLFCCYAGLRYSDFVRLTADNIVEVEHRTWVHYRSLKTGTEVRVPLYLLFDGKGVALLRKYGHDLPGFFHLADNSKVNKALAVITRSAGIAQRVTFHTARHTNATLLIYKGVSITTVQRLLGHKSVKTTQIYANIMDMTVVEDLEKNKSAEANDGQL